MINREILVARAWDGAVAALDSARAMRKANMREGKYRLAVRKELIWGTLIDLIDEKFRGKYGTTGGF